MSGEDLLTIQPSASKLPTGNRPNQFGQPISYDYMKSPFAIHVWVRGVIYVVFRVLQKSSGNAVNVKKRIPLARLRL